MAGVDWRGVLLPRTAYKPEVVSSVDRVMDAAKRGAWDVVFASVDARECGVNDWRIGGTSWFSPLHQAAWHGAPVDVVQGLIERGAWRTLRTAQGKRAVDIARERGHVHLVDELAPVFKYPVSAADIEGMNRQLAELVTDAARRVLAPDVPIRHLDVAGMVETGVGVGFSIPGMYGGFSIALYGGRLHVESWSRVVGGSGRAYVITGSRSTLVDEGFV